MSQWSEAVKTLYNNATTVINITEEEEEQCQVRKRDAEEAAQSVAEEATKANDNNIFSNTKTIILNHNQITMEGIKHIKINIYNNVVDYRCSATLAVAYSIYNSIWY